MSSDPKVPANNGSGSKTWRLPDGIEDHIESGLIKAGAGMVAGGLCGMLLFRSGSGWRPASVAAGLGVAVGSTASRLQESKTIQVRAVQKLKTFPTDPPPIQGLLDDAKEE